MNKTQLADVLAAIEGANESETAALYLALTRRMAERGYERRGYWTRGTSRGVVYLRRFVRSGDRWKLAESQKLA